MANQLDQGQLSQIVAAVLNVLKVQGTAPKAASIDEQIKAKEEATKKRRELWSAINSFVGRNGGWLVSAPHDPWLRIETRQDSELSDRLYDLGYDLRSTGTSERIIGGLFVPVACYAFTIPSGK
jgi:hypothetical protein